MKAMQKMRATEKISISERLLPVPRVKRRTGALLVACVLLVVTARCSVSDAKERVDPPVGVYRWANKPANIDAFSEWLGRPVWAEDFVGSESWDNVASPTWWLEGWSKWVHAKEGRRLVLAIPILAGPVDGSGPTQRQKGVRVPVALKAGAAGEYNEHFRQLAENLVKHKLTDTILRPGWEFKGGWYTWKAKGAERDFAEYWRQIVKTMRSVKGVEKLVFCWNPTLGEQDFPAEKAWPGDEFVDYVGLDVYDETWHKDTYPWPRGAAPAEIERRQKKAWKEWIMESPRGLGFWTKFAKERGKPLAIPDWGLNQRASGHGGGDNPYFIEQMHAFITNAENNVAFHCYFDINGSEDQRHQVSPGASESGGKAGTDHPRAAARFRELFGSR